MSMETKIALTFLAVALVILAIAVIRLALSVRNLAGLLIAADREICRAQFEETRARLKAERALHQYIDGVAFHTLPDEIINRIRRTP